MAKRKQNKKLYTRLRDQLTQLSSQVRGKKKPASRTREAVDRLEATVMELRAHVGGGDRKAAGRKAASTRAANSRKRSAAGRKAARTRASR